MRFKNKLLSFLFFTFFIIPISVSAYSDKIVLGGNNVGIEVQTNGIMIVGFYKVNNSYIGRDAGLELGDKIIKVNNQEINSINDMINKINDGIGDNKVKLSVLRGNKSFDTDLKLFKDDNNIYKTGLYVKDQISGIGTLTYIDPETNIFGALGHEIVESSSNIKVEVKSGKIFKSSVTGATKSTKSSTGEKNAIFYEDEVYGKIFSNTINGIFGRYTYHYDKDDLISVGTKNDVRLGEASIRTVLEGSKVESFEINILKVNEKSDTKNILFEIVDKDLLNKTNGVIKGMSGSPIVQNGKIIGAVTHAIVNDNAKGYGIFITTMLERGENEKDE